jgi:hemerythrin-like metal-binding protein
MALVWREQMQIGHPAIDEDHQYLIEIINEFLTRTERGDRHCDFDDIFTKLAHYTKLHFEREEKLQLASRYDGYRMHKLAHTQLLIRLKNLHHNFSSEPNPSTRLRMIPDLTQFLRTWLVEHILEEDRKLKPALSSFVMKGPLPPSPREVAAQEEKKAKETAAPSEHEIGPPGVSFEPPAARPKAEPETMVYQAKERKEPIVEYYSTETGLTPTEKPISGPIPTRAPSSAPATVPARPVSSGEKLDIGLPETSPKPKPSGSYLDDEPMAPAAKRHGQDAWRAELEAELARNKKSEAGAPPPDIPHILEEHKKWLASGGKEGERANLEGLDLSGVNLAEARLSNANLRNAAFPGANCRAGFFDGSDMRFSDISGSLFADANLANARLRHADLSFCDLSAANLRGADLSGARLKSAKLPDADLNGAIMLEVDLEDADLSSAKGVIPGQIKKAKTNSGTRLPPGVRLGGAIEVAGPEGTPEAEEG